MRKQTGRKETIRKVWNYLRHYRLLLGVSLLLSMVIVAATLSIPILVGRTIDGMMGKGQCDFSGIATLLLTIGILAGGISLLQWVMNTLNNRVTYHVVRDLREDVFAHMQHLPLSYLDMHPSGEMVSRVIGDADQFGDGLLMGFTQFFTGVMTILGTLCFMIYLNAWIALVVIVLTPLSIFVAGFIAKKTYAMFRLQSETRAEQTALIDEMVGNQKIVQAFSHEGEALESFDAINGRLEKCSLRAIFFSSLTNPSTRFVNNLVYAAVALTGAMFALGGYITIGGVTSFLSYATQYAKPFNEISGVVTELQNSLACAGRLFQILEEPMETEEGNDAVTLSKVRGQVSMQEVSFSYTPYKPLIEHLNLQIHPGQKIAIVGPTGCGKTTLINLLMRFYDVKEGSIAVEGKDIRTLTRESLRRSYGMVLQDTWLKAGTIKENLLFAKEDATEEEMIQAAKTSHAHSFIRRLPQGYDTLIGEEGEGLSAGQKQLLCITRLMLCHPPMLILDEATSSIDTRTEIRIQRAFDKLMEGRTTFIVAHRLSTIQHADVILVMKEGHIIEQGNHETLLKAGGFYSNLYYSQFAS